MSKQSEMRPIAEILVEVNAKTTAQLLAEHYQKTYELTYEFWKQRNRTFILLIGVIGVATLLTFRPFRYPAPSTLLDSKCLGCDRCAEY